MSVGVQNLYNKQELRAVCLKAKKLNRKQKQIYLDFDENGESGA